MLYFVKVRIDLNKLAELGKKISSGGFEANPQSTFCLKGDPAVGLNIWEAEDDADFERKFAPHREYYAEVYEVTPVITAVQAQQLLVEQMTAGN
jgi:hypothetical protein